MKSVLSGVCSATIALAFALPVSAQTLLRLDPPEGQVSRYVYSMAMTMENPMMPTSGPAVSVRADQTLTILGTADDVIRVRAAIDSAAATMAIPGAPPAPDLTGVTLDMDMDSRGVVLNIDAAETSGDAEQFARGLLESSNFYWLPEAEVGSGDSWIAGVPVPLSLGGPAETTDVELTYTLTSLEDGRATITFTGPVESTLDLGGMPAGISGELNGSMIVDLAAGRYVRQESLMALEMAVGGMAMPMETTMTLELVTDPS
jgi:hypothetical protein